MSRTIDKLEEWYKYNKDYYPQETIDNFVTTEDVGSLIKEFRELENENRKLNRAIGKYAGQIQEVLGKQQNLFREGLDIARNMSRTNYDD